MASEWRLTRSHPSAFGVDDDAVSRTTLAIDIGATTVATAVARNGRVDSVRLVPAVLGVSGDGVVVGESARALGIEHPVAVIDQLVRRLGDTAPIVLGGRAHSMAELLGALVDDAALAAEIDPGQSRLVLTHPAAWRQHRLDALTAIALERGFAALELRSTPFVIAEASSDSDGLVLVIDAGGSTVEASVVAITPEGSELHASQQLERLGGNDFDQAVFSLVSATIDGMIGDLDRRDPQIRRSLIEVRSACTVAKERLSTDTDTTIPISLPQLETAVRITRTEFESLIRPQAEAVAALVDRVLASAQIATEQLTGRLLIGGSSQVPLLAELLAGRLACQLTVEPDPMCAVASAAAVADSSAPSPSTSETNETGVDVTDEEGTTVPEASEDGPASNSSIKRSTPPRPPGARGSGLSTGVKLAAAGAAVTAVATGAAIAFTDVGAAAFEGDDDAPADAPVAAPAGPAGTSMDEFDNVTNRAAGGGSRPDPDVAASFRPEPQDAIGRAEPRLGSTTEEARAELRDDVGSTISGDAVAEAVTLDEGTAHTVAIDADESETSVVEPALTDTPLINATVEASPGVFGTTDFIQPPDGSRPTSIGDQVDPGIDDIIGDAIYSEIVQAAATISAPVDASLSGLLPAGDQPVIDTSQPAPVEIQIAEVSEPIEVGHAFAEEAPGDFASDNLQQPEELADIGSLPVDDGLG